MVIAFHSIVFNFILSTCMDGTTVLNGELTGRCRHLAS